jgi:hypothetical protein
MRLVLFIAALVTLVGCNSTGHTSPSPMDYQSRDFQGMTTDQEDDAYWRNRERTECNDSDIVMVKKCKDALDRERAKGLAQK